MGRCMSRVGPTLKNPLENLYAKREPKLKNLFAERTHFKAYIIEFIPREELTVKDVSAERDPLSSPH
jgi:hypothetical protein